MRFLCRSPRSWLLCVVLLAAGATVAALQVPQPPGTPVVIAPGVWAVTPFNPSITVGSTLQLVSTSGAGTTWSSSSPTVATVDGTGLVVGVGVGTTVVTARKDNKNGQTRITVVAVPLPPVDCVLSPWSAWSTCTNGQQTRTRTILTPPSNGGLACGPLTETQSCLPPPPTPVDCVVSDWSAFGACINGQQTRTRTVLQSPSGGGASCPALTETVSCGGGGVPAIPLTTQEAIYPGSTTGVARTNEPLTVGVPLPDTSAGVTSVATLGLSGAAIGQFRCLGLWPSGRCKWALVDTQLPTLSAGGSSTALVVTTGGTGNFGGSNLATENATTITVATGAATFTIKKANHNGIDTAVIGGTTVVAAGASDGFVVVGPSAAGSYPANVTCSPTSGGATCNVEYKAKNDAGSTCTIEENGPARTAIKCDWTYKDGSGNPYMQGTARYHFYANKRQVRVVSTLRNADYGASNSFAAAYKGISGYELRTGVNISTAANTATIGNHTATPTTFALTGTDTAYLYQAYTSTMQSEYQGFAYQNATDQGYTIAKNGSTVTTGTPTQPVKGWCDIANASGVGLEVGVYQMGGSYPKGCRYGAAGQVLALSLLPAASSQPYYIEWPQWNELTDTLLNFHTTAPTSLQDDFLRFQHPLVARAAYTAYNDAGVFPTRMVAALTEDTYYSTVAAAASPEITNGNKWAIANVPQFADFGTASAAWPLVIWRTFGWDLESDYRYGYLLAWITRGWAGRYLNARNFYDFQTAYMLAHSDGFAWYTDHPGDLNAFGFPNATVSANRLLGTHPGTHWDGHNWRDQEHGFWYGQTAYCYMSGDQFCFDALVDQQQEWFGFSLAQQAAGTPTGQIDVTGTSVVRDSGLAFNAQQVGQVLLIGASKVPAEVVSIQDASHLTLRTAPGNVVDSTYILADGGHGLSNQRALATHFAGAARFGSFLREQGLTALATTLETNTQHLFDFQVKSKLCSPGGYPAGCAQYVDRFQSSTMINQGFSRERGFHWGNGGFANYVCGTSKTLPGQFGLRASGLFQEALLAESLIEYATYRGSGWADYALARDIAYGLTQMGKSEGYYSDGVETSWATNGFRAATTAIDWWGNCQEPSTTWVWTVTISGTAVTRVTGPDFDISGAWTSSYAFMETGQSAFVCGGIPRQIASVASANSLTLATASGNGTLSCYFREETFDEPYANGQLTDWAMYFVRTMTTGDVSWVNRFNMSLQRSMAVAGLSFRDIGGYHLQHTIALLSEPPTPLLTTRPITSVVHNGGGSYTIGWAASAGATYRVKWSDKTVVDLIGFNPNTAAWTGDPATQMNWFGAENVATAPTCTSSCTVTIATGVLGLTSGNFSVKSTAAAPPVTSPITNVAWTRQSAAAGWPGYNGFLNDVYDPVSGQIQHYGVVAGSSSIYSSNQSAYNVGTGVWTGIGGNNSITSNCTVTWPTWPTDRHPYGQMAVDTLRNRLWLMGGVCSGVNQADMGFMGLNANPAANTWTRVTPAHFPDVLNSGAMVYDAVTDLLILFGPNGGSFLKVWVYAPSASVSAAQIAAGATSPQDWIEVTYSGGGYIGAFDARVVYSQARQQVVIYGGSRQDVATNALWTYTPATKAFAQRCLSPCVPPPVNNGPGTPPTFAFVEVPAAGVFFYHQTHNTGAPRDWTFSFGASAATDSWTVVPSTGSGPVADATASYDPVRKTVVLWTRNVVSGLPELWLGVLTP